MAVDEDLIWLPFAVKDVIVPAVVLAAGAGLAVLAGKIRREINELRTEVRIYSTAIQSRICRDVKGLKDEVKGVRSDLVEGLQFVLEEVQELRQDLEAKEPHWANASAADESRGPDGRTRLSWSSGGRGCGRRCIEGDVKALVEVGDEQVACDLKLIKLDRGRAGRVGQEVSFPGRNVGPGGLEIDGHLLIQELFDRVRRAGLDRVVETLIELANREIPIRLEQAKLHDGVAHRLGLQGDGGRTEGCRRLGDVGSNLRVDECIERVDRREQDLGVKPSELIADLELLLTHGISPMKGLDRVGNRQTTVYQKVREGVKKIMSILRSFTLPRGPVVRLLRTALVLDRQDREQSVGVYRNWLQAVDVALDTWPITPDNDYVIRNAQTGQVCIWLSHVPGLESDHCVLTHYYADELLYSERYSIKLAIQADGKGCTQVFWIRTEV